MAKVTKANYAAKLKAAILNAAVTGKLTGGTTGWKTVKLGEVCEKVGKKENQILEKEILPEGDFAVVSQGKSLIDGYSNQEDKVIRTLPCIMFGDHTKNVKYIDFPFIIGADGTKFFKPSNTNVCDTKYLYYWVAFAATQIGDRGYGRHYGLLDKMPFPLPPLPVQREIVGKVEELMPLVEEYGRAEEARQKLDAEFPEKLRKSILDLAIHGKLVAQDPAEPPAAVGASVTTPPYALPPNWKWVKLGEVCDLISGRDLMPSQYNGNQQGIPYITGASNIEDGNVLINRWTQFPVVIAKYGDLLLTCKGTVGKLAFLKEEQVHIARQIMALREKRDVSLEYIRIVIEVNVEALKAQAKSMIPGIDRRAMLEMEIPLPPLGEQKRIVEKVAAMMKALEGLVAAI